MKHEVKTINLTHMVMGCHFVLAVTCTASAEYHFFWFLSSEAQQR